MYTQDAIDALTERIAWAAPVDPSSSVASSIVLTSDNEAGTSGRNFRGFNSLCTVENVQMTMQIANITLVANPDNTLLNARLLDFKVQGAIAVLDRVFNGDDSSMYQVNGCGNRIDISTTDWTDTIVSRIARFDTAFGNQVAYDVLSMMLASPRSNNIERSIFDKGLVPQALEGAYVDGKLVKQGLAHLREKAILALITAFFPPKASRPTATFFKL